jgi:hypothetical protein
VTRPGRVNVDKALDAPDLGGPATFTSITPTNTDDPDVPVDAWDVLQRIRGRAAEADPVRTAITLEHIIRPAGGFWGGIGGFWGGIGGFWGGIGGFWGGIGQEGTGLGSASGGVATLNEYGVPGLGGRMPVALTMPDPALRLTSSRKRTPVVAMVDTGIAKHPWFDDPATVERLELDADGQLVPEKPPLPDPSKKGPIVGARGPLEGHGTFIAGLIRQGCPAARILSVTAMDGAGVVEEGQLLRILEAMLARHVKGVRRGGDKSHVIDVLSLSIGYYAEDSLYTSGPVADLLGSFREQGILVVAGVGNDATSAPFVPAALAATVAPGMDKVPVASVGAWNPNGATVALFSNDLPVVTYLRHGVSVVSTLPPTDGMGQPSSSMPDKDGRLRTTVDFDDYRGGFGVWSGTSFATPILAAELAEALTVDGDIGNVTPAAMTERALKALNHCLKTAAQGAS